MHDTSYSMLQGQGVDNACSPDARRRAASRRRDDARALAYSLGGFISFSTRPWAEGCESTPVPYIEGWWVAPDLRRHGVGRELVEAVDARCREHGYRELGSDVEVENEVSLKAHASLGFEPTLRVQFFHKLG